MKIRGFEILGKGADWSPQSHGAALREDHRTLLNDFGPGEFLRFYDLLAARHVQTLGSLFDGAQRSALRQAAVFATSSRGGYFVIASEDARAPIVLLSDQYPDPDDEAASLVVGSNMDDWLLALVTPRFAPSGLLVPFFIPSGSILGATEYPALTPGSDQREAMFRLRGRMANADAMILVYDDSSPVLQMRLWLPALEALIAICVTDPAMTRAAFDGLVQIGWFSVPREAEVARIFSLAGWELGSFEMQR